MLPNENTHVQPTLCAVAGDDELCVCIYRLRPWRSDKAIDDAIRRALCAALDRITIKPEKKSRKKK